MSGLTYDAGALIAAERGDRRMWRIHTRALARGRPPVVPAPVLIEVYRSATQVDLARFLKGCDVDALDKARAKASGGLLAHCRIDFGAVDAACVEGALRRGDAVVTSNHEHLVALATGVHKRLDIIHV